MLSFFFYLHFGVSLFQDEKKASKEQVGLNSWMSNMSPIPLDAPMAHTFGLISIKQIPFRGISIDEPSFFI